MANLNLGNDATVPLPLGFKFQPSDEELIVNYLRRKAQSLPLAEPIPDADVCKSDPWTLSGDLEKKRYFFAIMEKKGKQTSRKTTLGCWKASGTDKKILSSKTKEVVGTRKILVFYTGNFPERVRSDWIMHEYKLANPIHGMENLVLCKIVLKRRPSQDEGMGVIRVQQPTLGNMGEHGSSSSLGLNYDISNVEKENKKSK